VSPETAPAGAGLPEGTSSVRCGDLELIPLLDGFFRLDGGAMFGVVPKVLWSARVAADERNRVRLAMRPVVVRGSLTVLVDAGIGDKTAARQAEIYGLERTCHLDRSLAAAGLTPDAIDLVVATHLHFDHAGGFTVRGDDGRLRPRFPRARYVVRRGEWEEAMAPNERTRASYLAENLLPLAEAGVLDLIDADATLMPGVRLCRTGGHTAHHQMVVVESGGRSAVIPGDMIPTVAHLPESWVMGYDLYPLDTLSFRRSFLRDAVARESLVFFEHDPAVAAGYVRERDGKRVIEPVL
jgi:glyoxylase-like metal-dependent hydrolase (beta-lactamase superfamily II)